MGSWQLPTDLVNSSQGLLEGTAKWAYNVTDGAFWSMLLFGFCIVLTMASSRYGIGKAMAFGAVTGLLGSIMLLTAGLMPWWIGSIFIISGSFAIAWLVFHKKS